MRTMKSTILPEKEGSFYNLFVILLFLFLSMGEFVAAKSQITVSVTNITSSTCRVSWTPVTGATKYKVSIGRKVNKSFWVYYPQYDGLEVSASTAYLNVTGIQLVSGTEYDPLYRIAWIRAFKNETELEDDSEYFYVLLPGPPIEVSSVTTTTIDLALFQSPTIPSNQFDYKINVQTTNGDVWSNHTGYPQTILKPVSTHKITGLTPGISYRILLQSYRDEWTDWSEKMVPTVCNPPVALDPKNLGPNSFTPSWTNATGATSFKVYLKEKASGKTILNGYETTNAFLVRDLEPGTQYEYQITSVNESGESAKSNTISATTTVLQIPVAYAADNITSSSFRARWSSVSGASGYRLEVNDGNVIKYYETSGVNYTLTYLKPNFLYKYKVRALYNSNVNFSGTSNEISVTTFLFLNLWAAPAEGGTMTGNGSYAPGTSVTIKATANEGWEFVNWTNPQNQEVSKNATYTFTLNNSMTLFAEFKSLKPPTKYTLTLKSNPEEGGTVLGEGIFDPGTKVNINATPNKGYKFVNWTDRDFVISIFENFTYTLSSSRTLTANFEVLSGMYDQKSSLINIYPNPASDFISVTGITGQTEVKFYNSTGINVLNTTIEKNDVINIASLQKGLYFVVLESGLTKHTFRIIKN